MRISVLGILLASLLTGNVMSAEQSVPAAPERANKIRVLVVTGGHKYEPSFFDLFEHHPDIVYQSVVHPDAEQWFAPDKAGEYDVMVWYDLFQDISDEGKANLVKLLNKGKPLVALHHSLADYVKWPEGIKIIGGRYNLEPMDGHPGSTFKHVTNVKVHVVDPNHPVTKGLLDFALDDEVYGDLQMLPNVKPLLTTDHPDSSEMLAWTHTYGKSPVVTIQSGHDKKVYWQPSYRRLIAQSIRFVAGRLPDPSEDGFVELFNGKDFDGWTIMGSPKGWEIKDGMIFSEYPYRGNWIRHNKKVKDFILRVDYRVSREGNSGVFVRASDKGEPWLTGSELQITTNYRDDAHCTGSLYGVVPVSPRPDETPEVWHDYEIHCVGPYYKVFVDNVPVIDVDARRVPALAAKPREGYVGVQDNHSETGWVEYRSIRIKEIKMDPTQAWRLGTQAYTFNRFTFFDAVDKAKALGLDCIEAYPGQKLSKDYEDIKMGHDMPVEMYAVVQNKLKEAGVSLVTYGVIRPTADEKQMRQVFEFCKAMGIETITAEPAADSFDLLEKLTEDYNINIALHNHPKPSMYWSPESVLKAVEGRNKHFGACADTGHWVRSGLDPVECLKKLEGRIISTHFKDLNVKARDAHDVPWGTGVCDARALLAELQRQGFEGAFSIEYEYNWENSMPEVAECVAFYQKTVAELQK